MASRRTPSTGALESFCEFFSCMQLEYCLREPLSKFEGKYFLLQLIKREHFVLHIWDIRPIPTIRTTVRIIYMLHNGHSIYHALSFMHAHTYNNYYSMTLMFTIPVVV